MAKRNCGVMSRCVCPVADLASFLPFSILLGTLIAFTGLNQHSEVVAMKAAGLIAHQMLAPPLIIASLVVAGALFAFNETRRRQRKAARSPPGPTTIYEPVPPEASILSNGLAAGWQ